MKKIILIVLLFNFYSSNAQSLEELKLKTNAYYDAMYNIDIEKIIDFTYPNFYSKYSKEQIYTVIEQGFDNEKYRSRLVFPKITFNFGEIKTLGKNKIVIIQYKNTSRMTFENKLSKEEINKISEEIIKNTRVSKVTFEEKRNSLFLEGNFRLIAISDETTNFDWKFLDYSPKHEEMAKEIISSDLLQLLNP